MAADVFGQRVDAQAGANGFGLEQIGRGHGVVNQIDQAVFPADGADVIERRDLRGRVGDGFRKNHAGVGLDQGADVLRIGDVGEINLDAEVFQSFKQAVRIAEQKGAGDQVVSRLQQGGEYRGQRGHAA